MNFIHIAGHLGADPETRFTSSGKKVTTLRVATKARKGQNDDTIWWRVTLWGDQFDKMIPYLKKGSAIMVFGELQKPEIFNDREGKPQISMEITAVQIQFSPFGKPGGQTGGQQGQAQEGSAAHAYTPPPTGNSFSENAPNPYMGGNGAGRGTVQAQQGQTFDDEVPF